MVRLYFLWRDVSAVARGLDVSVILELYRLLIARALSAEWPLSVEPNPEVKSSAKVHGILRPSHNGGCYIICIRYRSIRCTLQSRYTNGTWKASETCIIYGPSDQKIIEIQVREVKDFFGFLSDKLHKASHSTTWYTICRGLSSVNIVQFLIKWRTVFGANHVMLISWE